MKRLVVLRHAKSDWTQPVSDRQRPITSRGARQAGEAGEWLAAQPWQIDLTYTGLTAGETCTTTLDGNCGGATTTVTHPTTTGSVIAITCTAANPTTITYSCTVC